MKPPNSPPNHTFYLARTTGGHYDVQRRGSLDFAAEFAGDSCFSLSSALAWALLQQIDPGAKIETTTELLTSAALADRIPALSRAVTHREEAEEAALRG